MTLPRPIRYDIDMWLVMRNDPVLPKAIIRRFVHQETGRDYYRVVSWDLDSRMRKLIGRFGTLEDASAAVLYDPPSAQKGIYAGAPNGRRQVTTP